MFNAFFDSASLADAAQLIDQIFQTPVIISDAADQVLLKTRSDAEPSEENNFTDNRIYLNNILVGHLYMELPESQGRDIAAGSSEDTIQKFLCFPLSLWFNRKNIENLVTIRLKNDFVWNLATRNYDSFSEMVRQGLYLHFDLNKPYTCVALKGLPATGQDHQSGYSTTAAFTTSNIEALLIRLAQEENFAAMISARSFDFILFLENKRLNAEGQIELFIDKANSQLKASFPEYNFYWGISEISSCQTDFDKLYHHAETSLRYCLSSSSQRYRFTYRDSREAQIISGLSKDESIRKIAEDIIAPLRKADTSSGMDLINTLITYIKCKYNISQTARELHIHRQSLLYRLDKIESLMQVSLKHYQDLFLLEIATHLFFLY